MQLLSELETQTDQHLVWVPVTWACSLVDQARQDGLIRTDLDKKDLTDHVIAIKGNCGSLMGYSSVNIPLVYTQVGEQYRSLISVQVMCTVILFCVQVKIFSYELVFSTCIIQR